MQKQRQRNVLQDNRVNLSCSLTTVGAIFHHSHPPHWKATALTASIKSSLKHYTEEDLALSKAGHRSCSTSAGGGVVNYDDKVLVWEDRFARQRFVLSIPVKIEYIALYLHLQAQENTLLSTYTVDITPQRPSLDSPFVSCCLSIR